jgi:hypothetical protein
LALAADLAPCQLVDLGDNGPSGSDSWLNEEGNGPMEDYGVGLTLELRAANDLVVAVETVADRAGRATHALHTRLIGGHGFYTERRSFFFE